MASNLLITKARSALNSVTAPEPAKSFVKFGLAGIGIERFYDIGNLIFGHGRTHGNAEFRFREHFCNRKFSVTKLPTGCCPIKGLLQMRRNRIMNQRFYTATFQELLQIISGFAKYWEHVPYMRLRIRRNWSHTHQRVLDFGTIADRNLLPALVPGIQMRKLCQQYRSQNADDEKPEIPAVNGILKLRLYIINHFAYSSTE